MPFFLYSDLHGLIINPPSHGSRPAMCKIHMPNILACAFRGILYIMGYP